MKTRSSEKKHQISKKMLYVHDLLHFIYFISESTTDSGDMIQTSSKPAMRNCLFFITVSGRAQPKSFKTSYIYNQLCPNLLKMIPGFLVPVTAVNLNDRA